jgi:WD40 repeat protein
MSSSRWIRVTIVTAALLAGGAGVWTIVRGPHDEFATLSGHKNGAYSLALAPDGDRVATGGGEGEVRIWDVANKRELLVLTGHHGRVGALAWSPDGGTIASGGIDKSVRFWDAESGERKDAWTDLPDTVGGLAYSSDGKVLAATVEGNIFFRQVNNSRKPQVFRGHAREISGMAFLPGQHVLATYSYDKTVCLWDLDSGRRLALMPGPAGHCHGLAVSADGKTLACLGGGRVHLYDLERRTPLDAIEPGGRTLCGVAFSPDRRTLALGSEDKVVVLWDLPGKKVRTRLRGHGYAVGPLTFLPDGRTLITSSHDSTLKLWKIE